MEPSVDDTDLDDADPQLQLTSRIAQASADNVDSSGSGRNILFPEQVKIMCLWADAA